MSHPNPESESPDKEVVITSSHVRQEQFPNIDIAIGDHPISASSDRSFAKADDECIPPQSSLSRTLSYRHPQSTANTSGNNTTKRRRFSSFRLPTCKRIPFGDHRRYLSRKFVSKRWYRLAFIAIVVVTVASTVGIGSHSAVGTHEPLHVVGVDGNSPREGVGLSKIRK
jgi:hypothetical protein